MASNVSSQKLNRVPETLLKKRKQSDEQRARKASADLRSKQRPAGVKKLVFKRAEKFIKEYRVKQRDEIRITRVTKKHKFIDTSVQHKLVLIIRIRGKQNVHPRAKRVLQLLRLSDINEAVFVKMNSATQSLLRIVEPYVTWGCPNLKSIRELVYKRGRGKVGDELVALTDNSLIERELGQYGVICLEDIIHELVTVGPSFKHVNNFLSHFRLNAPSIGWKKPGRSSDRGGDSGDRGDRINQLLKLVT